MTMTGSGWGTGPGHVLWFCHLCHSSFVLEHSKRHLCAPKPPPAPPSR